MKEIRKSNVNFGKSEKKDDKFSYTVLKTSKKAINNEAKLNLTSKKTKEILKSEVMNENEDPNIVRKFTFGAKTSNNKGETKGFQFVDLKHSRTTNHSFPEVKKIDSINDEMKTSQIKVVARFRQENEIEKKLSKDLICVEFISKTSIAISDGSSPKAEYSFDAIFNRNTNQYTFYNEVASPTIEEVLKGYNGTIFTYGQSGSGKTYTIFGDDIFDDVKKGIIPRSIDQVFSFIEKEENEKIEFQLKFSILEIYKETLYDLLNPVKNANNHLKIKEDPKKGIFVENLSEPYIEDKNELLFLLDTAEENRYVNETKLNKSSSRSHIVFILHILQKLPDGVEKKGILNMIDLAGSERVTKTGAIGETLEEAKKINSSLSCLGNVINCLSSGNSDFIPYRESKLTRLLKDSLGGNFKTTLVVTCSPHFYNIEETISSLNFAKRAKKIKNKVKINIKRDPEELERIISSLQEKLRMANDEISKLTSNSHNEMIMKTSLSLIKHFSSKEKQEFRSSENNITSSHIVTTDDESKIHNLSIKRATSANEYQEEINRLKDQIFNLKQENKLLKMRNVELENLLNIDKVVLALEMSVEKNIIKFEKTSIFTDTLLPQEVYETLSNLNKNFNEYLEILEEVKRYKGFITKRNALVASINGEGSFTETHKRRFIREVSKTSKKRYTSQGLISQMLSHNKYSNDVSNCISFKGRESIIELENKDLIQSTRGNKKNRIPLPMSLNLEKLEKSKYREGQRESINETLFPMIEKTLKSSFNYQQIHRVPSGVSNIKDDIYSTQLSVQQREDPLVSELRILKKQKRINGTYIRNLLEELNVLQKNFKDLEKKYKEMEEINKKNHFKDKDITICSLGGFEQKGMKKINAKEMITKLLQTVLSESIIASKKIDYVLIKIHSLSEKNFEIKCGSGLNMKIKSFPYSRNLHNSLNGDLDDPEI